MLAISGSRPRGGDPDICQRQRKAQPTVRRVPKAAPVATDDAEPPRRASDAGDSMAEPAAEDAAAPKKRRRRRRKPTGSGASEGGAPAGEA